MQVGTVTDELHQLLFYTVTLFVPKESGAKPQLSSTFTRQAATEAQFPVFFTRILDAASGGYRATMSFYSRRRSFYGAPCLDLPVTRDPSLAVVPFEWYRCAMMRHLCDGGHLLLINCGDGMGLAAAAYTGE